MLGRAYYKGGFEPRINRREAALILELPYVTQSASARTPFCLTKLVFGMMLGNLL